MGHIKYDFTAGDTGSKIRVALHDSRARGLIVPFDGVYNAAIWVKPAGGSAVRRAMTNLTGANDGYAEYQFTASELVEGTLTTQVEITKVADGTIVSQLDQAYFKVGPKL